MTDRLPYWRHNSSINHSESLLPGRSDLIHYCHPTLFDLNNIAATRANIMMSYDINHSDLT